MSDEGSLGVPLHVPLGGFAIGPGRILLFFPCSLLEWSRYWGFWGLVCGKAIETAGKPRPNERKTDETKSKSAIRRLPKFPSISTTAMTTIRPNHFTHMLVLFLYASIPLAIINRTAWRGSYLSFFCQVGPLVRILLICFY